MILTWKRTGPCEMRTECGRYRIDKSDSTPSIYTLYVLTAPEKWTRINWWPNADAAKSHASEHALRVKHHKDRMDTLDRGGVVRG